ncbi:MAG: Fur family transcriptional regulator [Campylobacterota bacterium]
MNESIKKDFEAHNVDYDQLLEDFKAILRKNGLKYTKQRELILKALHQNNGHFSPEVLYNLVQQEDPAMNIGIATVYRTLGLLEDEGLVSSLSFGAQGKKYELGVKEHHDHIICTECGKIVEFCDEKIEKRQEKIAKFFKFQITDHTMKIYGVCPDCQRK